VFLRFAPYVGAVGLRILGRRDEIDDLVQDVFLEAARGLSGLRDPRAVKAWLATITVRLARRRLRKRKLLRIFVRREAEEIDVADPAASPEQRALLAQVYAVLGRLPVDDRIAWTLRHLEGERLERVALLCDCSLATAKRRIRRAHDAIGEAVSDGD
jgi:RNA polymerase sigma-70 factor (ECF subfamily)